MTLPAVEYSTQVVCAKYIKSAI